MRGIIIIGVVLLIASISAFIYAQLALSTTQAENDGFLGLVGVSRNITDSLGKTEHARETITMEMVRTGAIGGFALALIMIFAGLIRKSS